MTERIAGGVGGLGLYCWECVISQELLLVLECWINHWRVMSAERDVMSALHRGAWTEIREEKKSKEQLSVLALGLKLVSLTSFICVNTNWKPCTLQAGHDVSSDCWWLSSSKLTHLIYRVSWLSCSSKPLYIPSSSIQAVARKGVDVP